MLQKHASEVLRRLLLKDQKHVSKNQEAFKHASKNSEVCILTPEACFTINKALFSNVSETP